MGFPSVGVCGDVMVVDGGCCTCKTMIRMEDGEMEGKEASRRMSDRLRIPVIGPILEGKSQ